MATICNIDWMAINCAVSLWALPVMRRDAGTVRQRAFWRWMKEGHYNAYLVKGGITVSCLGHSEIPEKKTKAERGKKSGLSSWSNGFNSWHTRSVDSCYATSKLWSQKNNFLWDRVENNWSYKKLCYSFIQLTIQKCITAWHVLHDPCKKGNWPFAKPHAFVIVHHAHGLEGVTTAC